MHSSNGPRPTPTVSTFDAVCLILGTVIGAGIFKAPSVVAAHMGSVPQFLLVWLIGGLISVAGALCYAELARVTRVLAASTTTFHAPSASTSPSFMPGRAAR